MAETQGAVPVPAGADPRPGRETSRLVELEWSVCLKWLFHSARTSNWYIGFSMVLFAAYLGFARTGRGLTVTSELLVTGLCCFLTLCSYWIVVRETVMFRDNLAALDRLRRVMNEVAGLDERNVEKIRLWHTLAGTEFTMHRRLANGTELAIHALLSTLVSVYVGLMGYRIAIAVDIAGKEMKMTYALGGAAAAAIVVWVATWLLSRAAVSGAKREIAEAERRTWPEAS